MIQKKLCFSATSENNQGIFSLEMPQAYNVLSFQYLQHCSDGGGSYQIQVTYNDMTRIYTSPSKGVPMNIDILAGAMLQQGDIITFNAARSGSQTLCSAIYINNVLLVDQSPNAMSSSFNARLRAIEKRFADTPETDTGTR